MDQEEKQEQTEGKVKGRSSERKEKEICRKEKETTESKWWPHVEAYLMTYSPFLLINLFYARVFRLR